MLVYRIAHRTLNNSKGYPRGPYFDLNNRTLRGAFPHISELDDMESNHSYGPNLRPVPQTEGLYVSNGSDFYCGFSTVKKLKWWFNRYFRTLDRNGFMVYVYDVPREHVEFGRKQIIFDITQANLVKKISARSVSKL